jgi:hypothetical protein
MWIGFGAYQLEAQTAEDWLGRFERLPFDRVCMSQLLPEPGLPNRRSPCRLRCGSLCIACLRGRSPSELQERDRVRFARNQERTRTKRSAPQQLANLRRERRLG